ncbi:hypothetical protein GCM10022226_72740 [Sphaerisporangium flaviroseum]|uniref:Uncharacterized protein n=1 Tax=Sphaerisporangium flaviroseum TaxID=509199 RepID=A0ABP7JAS8_9ACTN
MDRLAGYAGGLTHESTGELAFTDSSRRTGRLFFLFFIDTSFPGSCADTGRVRTVGSYPVRTRPQVARHAPAGPAGTTATGCRRTGPLEDWSCIGLPIVVRVTVTGVGGRVICR